MATWTSKVVPIDLLSILLERRKLPGFSGDVYSPALYEDIESSNNTPEPSEAPTDLEKDALSVKKSNVFSDEITDKERVMIEQRVLQQRKKYQEYEKREYDKKAVKIRAVFDFLIDEEIKYALKDNNEDVEEVITQFTYPDYLRKVRKALSRAEPLIETSKMSTEQKDAYEKLVRRRTSQSKVKGEKSKRNNHTHTVPRLALDLALKQMVDDPEAAFEGWSEARIKAYKLIDVNPNAYYYRFNAPGEVQATGHWTGPEKKKFMERLKEIGADGQWGIFSMKIPGRVGYQCSNFYRQLILRKEISDPNYIIEPSGKIRYLFSGKQGADTGEAKKSVRIHSKKVAEKPRKKQKRRSSGSSSEDPSSDEEFVAPLATEWRTSSRNRRAAEVVELEQQPVYDEENLSGKEESEEYILNPLPGFIDPITLDEIVQPAISPYGHVMGYANWVRCLNSESSRNICPLTKQPLTKRDLTLLTFDNIEEYRSKIING